MRCNYLPIVELILNAVVAAADEAEATYKALQSLKTIWLHKEKWRKGSASLRSLELLIYYPVVTTDTLQRHLHVSRPAAWNALKQLESAGIVNRRATRPKKTDIYVAPNVLRIVNRPFGEKPEMPMPVTGLH
jgi:DNA-binding MarR family transcriptional regulator